MLRTINSTQFRTSVEQSSGVVVVDFYASWCGPCKMLAPVFENISKEFENKAEFMKVNVDDCIEIANRFSIRTVPTIMIFKNGKPVKTIVGFIPKEKLNKVIKSFI